MPVASVFADLTTTATHSPTIGVVLLVVLAIGLLKTVNLVLGYIAVLVDLFVLPAKSLSTYGSNNKVWAVVTGATAGIGEEFARQLAKAGFQVAIVSRNPDKLNAAAATLTEKYGVEVKHFALDAKDTSPVTYAKFATWVKEELGDVGVLINNVGQSHEMPVPFLETDDQELRDIINVNNVCTLEVTRVVAPVIQDTIKRKKVKRGLILTMGSFAGLTPTPLLAVYSGSKAFLQSWSSALAKELESSNIDVQLVISYLVTSNMSKIRRASATIPTAKAFVGSTIRSIGRRTGAQERYASTTPFWTHALMHWWIENTVGVYSALAATVNYSMHVGIRKRALRKKARLAEQAKKAQ
jgi:17beta-estradiol 17-dehydrogenase / very-long-chain 3-oxoacyl-CoA reductase